MKNDFFRGCPFLFSKGNPRKTRNFIFENICHRCKLKTLTNLQTKNADQSAKLKTLTNLQTKNADQSAKLKTLTNLQTKNADQSAN